MKYIAKKAFKGIIDMANGEVRELDENDFYTKDLINGGFIEPAKEKEHHTKKEK